MADDLMKLTKPKLRDRAEALGIDVGSRWDKKRIAKAIRDHQADPGTEMTPSGLSWSTLETLRRIMEAEVEARQDWQKVRAEAYFELKDDGLTLPDVWKRLEADPDVTAAERSYELARIARRVATLSVFPPSDPYDLGVRIDFDGGPRQ